MHDTFGVESLVDRFFDLLLEIFVVRVVVMEVVVGDGEITIVFVLHWLFSDLFVNYQRPLVQLMLGALVEIAMIWVQTLTSPDWKIGFPDQIEQSSPSSWEVGTNGCFMPFSTTLVQS